MNPLLRAISLGAGLQSTVVALMGAAGALGRIDCAIFADTGWEPKAVYEHLAWLRSSNVLNFPVHIVSAGNLRDAVLTRKNTTGGKFAAVPWYMLLANGKAAMGRRQCTKEYKLRPIHREVVRLLDGKRKRASAELLIGISLDEAARAKPSQVQYITNTFPLLDVRMSRRDCERWLLERDFPVPPKSSCIGCPFHSDGQWRALPPDEFADAVEVDRAIRVQAGARGQQFMHRSLRPLEDVDFSTAEERGQLNMFNNECEGLCGV